MATSGPAHFHLPQHKKKKNSATEEKSVRLLKAFNEGYIGKQNSAKFTKQKRCLSHPSPH
jgi:hypothetical protein